MIRKTKETSKRPIKIALWCFLLFMFAFISPMSIHAESDPISISGSFLENAYQLAAGSQMDALDSFIEVQNNTNETVALSLSAKVQDGLALVFQQGTVSLSANAKIRIPIGIIVDQTIPPGDYPLKLELTTVSSSQSKKVVVLTSILKVVAQTSNVIIHIVSPDQRPVEALIHLSQMVNGKAIGLRSIQTSSLNERLPYGEYRILVDGSGYQKMLLFTVDSPSQTKEVIFETIIIPSLSVTPQMDPKTKKAVAFDLVYMIDNLITEKSNIKIELSVYDKSDLIDLLDIKYLPTLTISKLQSIYRYVPKDPLSGKLTFKLAISDLSGTVLGSQASQTLDLRDNTWAKLFTLLGLGFVFAGLALALVLGSKQLKKRNTLPGKLVLSPSLAPINSVDPSEIRDNLKIPEPFKDQSRPVLMESVSNTMIKSVSAEEFSCFGIGFTLTGDVSAESSIIIKGKIIGNITSSKQIIIESGADIVGNVTAHDIEISGTVRGIITAYHELSLVHSAKVVGSIHTPTLSVEKGAILDCQITDHSKAEKSSLL